MSTIQRVTGTNSGLDVDALVKQSLQTYQTKIDRETQNKKVLEYQQEQYKQIMTDASSFYDKYFDVLKTGNLLSTTTYNTITFDPDDDYSKSKVTAKGFAGADVSDYKVTTTQIAAKASHIFKSSDLKNDGTDKISFSMGGKSIADVTVKSSSKSDMQAAVDELNSKLSTAGISATAKYSEFSQGIVLESGNMGGTVSFNAGLNGTSAIYTGQNAKGVIMKGTENYSFDQASNIITVDNVEFDLKAPTMAVTTPADLANLTSLTDLTDLTDLASLQETDAGVTTTTSASTTESGTKTITTIKSVDGKTTTVKTVDGTSTTIATTLTTTNPDGTTTTKTTTINPDGTKVTTSNGITTTTATNGTTATTDGTTTTTRSGGTITTTSGGITTATVVATGVKTTTNANGIQTVTSADGKTMTTTSGNVKTVTVKNVDGSTTTTTSQGTTQIVTTISATGSLTKTISNDSGTTTSPIANTVAALTGTTDVKALKDKIVAFVNDYNNLLQEINTKIYEKRDKDYMPLTDDQKKNMTDSQITAWEKKAQTGLLKGDSDLERIAREMKSAMSTVMSGSGLYLEKIGINPVDNYAEKNGMFTVDEDKLTNALEENAGNIKDLFTKDTGTTETSGIIIKLKSSLYSEFKTSTSSLSKKAGYDGSTTQYDNTLTNSINEKTTLIKKLNTQLSDKQDALYKKYSNLETLMEQMNSQQSSLAKMLGQS